MKRTVVHIVGGESRSRAEQARIVFALGQHAEVYATIEELLESAPATGVVFATETDEPGFAGKLIEVLGESGISLPVVITAPIIALERVVGAIRGGALDYLALPLEVSSFAERLALIIEQAEPYVEQRRLKVQAANRIAHLTPREREVLEHLSAGLSNKDIAEQLQISARTIEIHRHNMMHKLGASRSVEAVKVWLAANTMHALKGTTTQ